MKFTSSFALLAFASSALAHFTLDYPTSRGFDEDIENDNFCGGFHNVSLPRQPWYYRNGPIEIDSHHDSATVNIYLSLSPPTSAQSFLALSSLRHDIAITGQGEFCFHANATSVQGAAAGTNATIMVEYINNVHGHLYQCTDVTFTDDAKVGANLTCTDALTAAASAPGTSSSATGSASATSRSSSAATSSSTAPASSKANGAMGMVSVSVTALVAVPVAVVAGLFALA